MNTYRIASIGLALLLGLSFHALGSGDDRAQQQQSVAQDAQERDGETAMKIHYLEIVSPDVEATCDALAKMHGVSFSEPNVLYGNARIAPLAGGGRIGVRAPMRETEDPVVRPYILVDDLHAAVEQAKVAGAEIAIHEMAVPGEGTIAIYILGGIEHGLWQE